MVDRLASDPRADEPAGAMTSRRLSSPRMPGALWRIREDGAGLSARPPAGDPAHAGLEDAAVPPARPGTYLREFEDLLVSHGLTGVPYGHFGAGLPARPCRLPVRAYGR